MPSCFKPKIQSWMYPDTKTTLPHPIPLQHHPDARKHQIVSFIKSGIRILGYTFIPFSLVWATVLLILSEIVGIIEEIV